jgi:DNA invertase Pin-like site-specific DNA recombinase
LSAAQLRQEWERVHGEPAPPAFSRDLLARGIAWTPQEQVHGGLSAAAARKLANAARQIERWGGCQLPQSRSGRAAALPVTGMAAPTMCSCWTMAIPIASGTTARSPPLLARSPASLGPVPASPGLPEGGRTPMRRNAKSAPTGRIRCAIYTRKSTEEGLDQDFNSLDAQREACTSYINSQRHEGWTLLPHLYDDGGFSGGNMERPGLQRLLAEVKAGRVDVIVVYKVDRLTRSLTDFAKIVEVLDGAGASFVSVTQAFNTTTSMGRLTLNVLLSFAQFEREVIAERVRDKIAASKQKGMWMGGVVPMGYEVRDRKARHQSSRSRDGAPHHAALFGAGLGPGAAGGSESQRDHHQAAPAQERSGRRRTAFRPRPALSLPQEPDLCRRDSPSREKLSRRT